jgi:hypothetical protein
MPLHSIILYNADAKISEIIISTLVVGGVLLGAIPVFLRLAKRILNINQEKK